MTKKEQALVEQYAKSLVEVANEHGQINQLKSDILTLLETFEATNLDYILSSYALQQKDKANLVRLLKDTNSVYMNNFLELIIYNERENYLKAILTLVLDDITQVTNEYDVYVTSAVPLTEEQKSRVQSVVAKKIGCKTDRLIEEIDPSILGGFIIKVNNKVLDTSIKGQLHELKSKLI
ncbi:F0F1 ATP synthase subunit delta [Streptococcus iniae]